MSTIVKKQDSNFYRTASPLIISVFIIYLTIGMVIGVIPKFVSNNLKYSSFIVGIAVGVQFFSTLISRPYIGKRCDVHGVKSSHLQGIILMMITGAIYCLSAALYRQPLLALMVLLLARIIHGIAESMILVSAVAWNIGLAGSQRSGKVMSWNGIAMYGGMALGAPLSIEMTKVYNTSITFILAIMAVLPIISLLSTIKLPALKVDKTKVRAPFLKIVRRMLRQGTGLGLATIGYGCIISFITLYFMEKNWGNASLAFAVFGICYILVRIFFDSLPDKYGGYIIVLISLIIETIGQAIIGFSPTKTFAIIGCGITGIGFSLIYPGLGVLVVNRTEPQIRGTALGLYAAFLDLALGITGPLGGLIAGWLSYQVNYLLLGSISCLLAMIIISYKRNS